MRTLFAFTLLAASVAPAFAQDAPATSSTSQAGDNASMSQLLEQGYKIMTAVPNGKNFIVFLQKDTTAYACEFASLSESRCGVIN